MTFWIASAKERGSTAYEYEETDDSTFEFYNGVEITSSLLGKDYLWDVIPSYKELLRSTWWKGNGYIFSDVIEHTFADDGSVIGTLVTHRDSGYADSVENIYHFAPCFFIGG